MDEVPSLSSKQGRFPLRLVVALIAIACGGPALWWLSLLVQDSTHGSIGKRGVVAAADQSLPESDRAAIAGQIQGETSEPIRSLTRHCDGSVQAFVSSDEYLGGRIFSLRKFGDAWRVEQVTYLY